MPRTVKMMWVDRRVKPKGEIVRPKVTAEDLRDTIMAEMPICYVQPRDETIKRALAFQYRRPIFGWRK